MTPEQFLSHLKRQEPAPVYLFLGAEPYRRDLCRRALTGKALSQEESEQGVTRCDLQVTPLAGVVDDARSLSLFAPRRLIWASNAEAPLPKGRTAEDEEGAAIAPLAGYLKRPTPGVVLVLDASRYDTGAEDKVKLERVRKFYAAIPAQVEFARYTAREARQLASELAEASGVVLDQEGIELLVETLGADAMRIANEIEKLRLYAGGGKRIGARELALLVPDSSVSTIFVLVEALGRRDRLRALELVDTLVRQGEYMPLALSFLAALFRQALAAKEKGLRTPQQIQQGLAKPGRQIWGSRAEQIHRTATAFTKSQLETGLKRLFTTDRGLRDARPSDRIVMEKFILGLAD